MEEFDREDRQLLCTILDDMSVRMNRPVADKVLRRARGRCEGLADDEDRCSVSAEQCTLRIAREYGYSDAVDYGPLTARWVTLLCDECYEQSEDGQREAYESWVADQD